ncbi:hypothetical protein C1J02_12085 [Sulfitobacter sp. SK011]|nr:hypothetical protein C1J02_12085 [Sulfitobacter sp. SK011]
MYGFVNVRLGWVGNHHFFIRLDCRIHAAIVGMKIAARMVEMRELQRGINAIGEWPVRAGIAKPSGGQQLPVGIVRA